MSEFDESQPLSLLVSAKVARCLPRAGLKRCCAEFGQ